jgi:uncharacterized protein (DUF2147 family)
MDNKARLLTAFASKTVAALLLLGHVPSASAQSIFGRWLTDDRSAIVRIDHCGKKLCGRIERVLNPNAPGNDINNPDPKLRSKPLAGTTVLSGYVGSGAKWKGGIAYDPKAGASYRSELELLDNGTLKVTGCVLFVCRSRYWTRVD